MSNIDLILKAREHGKNFIYETPILFNKKFNEIVGKNIFIKPECLQVTGSFKFRCEIAHQAPLNLKLPVT